VSTHPFAPGSRPEATVAGGGPRLWVKVHRSQRQDDGSFRVAGRLLNLPRAVRELLKESLQPTPIDGKDPASKGPTP
jgi:hypothetical protein